MPNPLEREEREAGARVLAVALHQARLVVFDGDLDVVAYWNGSETFNVVDLSGSGLDVFMVDVERNVDQAARRIAEHLEEYRND